MALSDFFTRETRQRPLSSGPRILEVLGVFQTSDRAGVPFRRFKFRTDNAMAFQVQRYLKWMGSQAGALRNVVMNRRCDH